jgi:BASS family bile acid:Na+ symporter
MPVADPGQVAMRATALVEDYLAVWIVLAVALGLLVPDLAAITDASTIILAVMVGSVSLTLTVDRFRGVSRRGLGVTLVGHLLIPVLAVGLARLAGLAPPLVVGFALLGAVTPELVTPTMTELAEGDTALAATVLVVTGLGSLAVVPGALAILVGDAAGVDATAVVEQLLLAVVLPMGIAVGLRAQFDERIGNHERVYPALSAIMVVLIIGGVAAANADLVAAGGDRLVLVTGVALALNAVGYGLGWVLATGTARPTRIAASLSLGMRDFAVAAALVVAAGFPPVAALPALVFGIVELVSSAGLGRYFRRAQG